MKFQHFFFHPAGFTPDCRDNKLKEHYCYPCHLMISLKICFLLLKYIFQYFTIFFQERVLVQPMPRRWTMRIILTSFLRDCFLDGVSPDSFSPWVNFAVIKIVKCLKHRRPDSFSPSVSFAVIKYVICLEHWVEKQVMFVSCT